MTVEPYIVMILGYVLWFYVLLLGLVYVRFQAVKSGLSVLKFTPTGSEGPPFMNRVCRAHGNMVENFGPLALIVLAAYITGQTADLNGLAYLFLALRMAQSITHWISGTPVMMGVRGIFFFGQVGIQVYWIFALLT